jgi:hypothetical protein
LHGTNEERLSQNEPTIFSSYLLVSSVGMRYCECVFLPSVNREFHHKIVSSILSKDIEYSEAQKMALLLSRLTEDVATIPDLLSEFVQRRQSFSKFDRPPRSFARRRGMRLLRKKKGRRRSECADRSFSGERAL